MIQSENIPSTAQPGSWKYFAEQWCYFMKLCDEIELPQEQLKLAFGGLVHLSIYSEDSPPDSAVTLEMSMRAAFYRYERQFPNHPLY